MFVRLVWFLVAHTWPLVYAQDCPQLEKNEKNEFDGQLNKECPAGYHIEGVESYFHSYHRDRQFDWECSSTDRGIFEGVEQSCRWWKDINSYTSDVHFGCPSGGYVLTGVQSYHSNYWEDRKWSFKCCKPKRPKRCRSSPLYWTYYINSYQQDMEWFTPHYIVGVHSRFNSGHEDRIWKFRIGDVECDVDCTCPSEITSDWKVTDVTYGLNEAKIAQAQPRVIATQSLSNPSQDAKSKLTFTISESISNRFSFSFEAGMSLGLSSTVMVGIPKVADFSKTLSFEISARFATTTESETTKMFEVQFEVEAPPESHIRAEGVVKEIEVTVPYEFTVKHNIYDCTCSSSGIWHGVDQYDLSLRITDVNTELEMDPAELQSKMMNMYEAYVFPSVKVPKDATWQGNKTHCIRACDQDRDCHGVVMKTELKSDVVGDCYRITSNDLRNCGTPADMEDVEDFVVWMTSGTNNTCYTRPNAEMETDVPRATSNGNQDSITSPITEMQTDVPKATSNGNQDKRPNAQMRTDIPKAASSGNQGPGVFDIMFVLHVVSLYIL